MFVCCQFIDLSVIDQLLYLQLSNLLTIQHCILINVLCYPAVILSISEILLKNKSHMQKMNDAHFYLGKFVAYFVSFAVKLFLLLTT